MGLIQVVLFRLEVCLSEIAVALQDLRYDFFRLHHVHEHSIRLKTAMLLHDSLALLLAHKLGVTGFITSTIAVLTSWLAGWQTTCCCSTYNLTQQRSKI